MASLEEAQAAKEKFKQEYWSQNQERFNVLAIGVDVIYDTTNITTPEQIEDQEFSFDIAITQEYFVKAFLFDIVDVVELGLPALIDGVEIRYLPVMEKK